MLAHKKNIVKQAIFAGRRELKPGDIDRYSVHSPTHGTYCISDIVYFPIKTMAASRKSVMRNMALPKYMDQAQNITEKIQLLTIAVTPKDHHERIGAKIWL